jgi:NNP family nitrate/nitrite transporter-like MFS transporter
MPAIFDSLVHQSGLKPHVAWRVTFIVPFILITVTAISMLLLTEDTPTGKWADRGLAVPTPHDGAIVSTAPSNGLGLAEKPSISSLKDKKSSPDTDIETDMGEVQVIDEYQHETIQAPTFQEALPVFFSLQTLFLATGYVCSFGGELAINSILGAYYMKNFPHLGQTLSGRWAAMFGLLNVVSRPAGGFVGDLIYKYTGGSLWWKKMWIHFVGVVAGIFLIVIGQLDPHDLNTMIGLVAGMAMFLEAGNGANFALVPHVHPHANGEFLSTPHFKF